MLSLKAGVHAIAEVDVVREEAPVTTLSTTDNKDTEVEIVELLLHAHVRRLFPTGTVRLTSTAALSILKRIQQHGQGENKFLEHLVNNVFPGKAKAEYEHALTLVTAPV